MTLALIQHRQDSCWYEKMVSERIEELVNQLNEYDEVKDKFPSKLYELIKIICKLPGQEDHLLAAYNDTVLEIYFDNDKENKFIEITFNEQ